MARDSERDGVLCWGGSIAMREERGRNRRRLRAAALVTLVFCYGLFQVWMATKVAERGSRVSQLQREVSRLEENLALDKSRLASRQIYGRLLEPARLDGFGPGAQRRVLVLPPEQSPAQPGLWQQMTAELQRGSKLLLPEALAQDLWPEGRVRAGRP